MARSTAIGWEAPRSVRSPRTTSPAGPAAAPVERKATVPRLRISSSMVFSMFALSSSPSACIPPVPSRTRRDAPSASSAMLVAAGSSPTSSVASHDVTWIRRSCPAFAAAPVR
jgi:hypothetical protein